MTIFTYANLYRAYLACRKNKRSTHDALSFEWDLEMNLDRLVRELRTREYQPGCSFRFVVTEPKPREIFAADFRDRVVHHLFVNELLLWAERHFSYDSFACRTGKGTHGAVSHLRKLIDRKGDQERLFFLKLDIETFFPSIDKDILLKKLEGMIRKCGKGEYFEDEMIWLARKLVSHDPTDQFIYRGDRRLLSLVPEAKMLMFQPKGKGLPIGNYTSQFFANLYLDELDHFIKRTLLCRKYVRYADDFILVDADPNRLRWWRGEIERFLARRLAMNLHPKKTNLQPTGRGIDFLGYFMKPSRIVVRKGVVKRILRRLWKMRGEPIPESSLQRIAILESYHGHFIHARCSRLRQLLFWAAFSRTGNDF